MLAIRRLDKSFVLRRGAIPARVLAGIDLDIGKGELFCLLGASGCGKTTLLNILAGFETPTHGDLRLDGAPITRAGRDRVVFFQNADAAGLGVFQAARERHALVIGSNSNQNGVAPEVTLGSVVIDLPRAFLQIAKEVKAKTFQPRVVQLGEESRVVTLVLNPSLMGRIPATARTRIDSLQALMLAGRYTIHVDTSAARK